MYGQRDFIGLLSDTITSFLVLVLGLSVFVFLILLALVGYGLFLAVRWTGRQLTVALPRPFGAPPEPRWLAAYDAWLEQLEQVTGIDFNSSPGRLLAGALIVSVGPAMLFGGALSLLDTASGGSWLVVFTLLGIGMGLLSGSRLSQPASGWFSGGGNGGGGAVGEGDGFFLGEEIGDASDR